MRFLKTLFWMVLAAGIVLFARENWVPVTLKLWSGLEADVKLPCLLLVMFLIGFLPAYFVYRGRLWTLRRQLRTDRVIVGNQPGPRSSAPDAAAPDAAAPAPARDEAAADFAI
jgi:uncharacterized integral membrane protein